MAVLSTWQPKDWPVHVEWQPVFDAFWRSAEGERLSQFVSARLNGGAVVYPAHPLWALQLTPLSAVRVVILGQDPYHGPGQAQGLSFSVADGVKFPPSLRNIFKELQRDLQQPVPMSGSLEAWARRGVLLLNTSFTVEDGLPASHAKRGWESLSDAILREVALNAPACVYMLWGGHAQAKAGLIESATTQTAPDFLGLRERSALAAGSVGLAGGPMAGVEGGSPSRPMRSAAFVVRGVPPLVGWPGGASCGRTRSIKACMAKANKAQRWWGREKGAASVE